MDISKIPTGDNPPHELNAVIEIPMGDSHTKYEFDKDSGALFVDRFLHTAMRYPANYGFIPRTLAADGDPIDVLVVSPAPVYPGTVIRCRPIGVLMMEDEKGRDEKILAVPVNRLHPSHKAVVTYEDLSPHLVEQVAHFFEHYKDLEPGKWVTIGEWLGPDEACKLISQAIADYNLAPTQPHAVAADDPPAKGGGT
jgi:inorganic pyrophosphatase